MVEQYFTFRYILEIIAVVFGLVGLSLLIANILNEHFKK